MGVFVLVEVFALEVPVYTLSPRTQKAALERPYSPRTILSPTMDVLFPKRYALRNSLAKLISGRCNPPYIVRQPIIPQCVNILFHHYQF